jgi:hypothetical protein
MFQTICACVAIICALIISVLGVLDQSVSSVANSKTEPKIGGSDNYVKDSKTIQDKNTQKQFIKYMKQISRQKNIAPVIQLDYIRHKLKYESGAKIPKTTIHIGQRKLFLSELQFLSNVSKPGKLEVCIYAGAAPSNHMGLLSELLPNIKFILIDPNPFDIYGVKPEEISPNQSSDKIFEIVRKSNEKIITIQSLFTHEYAKSINRIFKGDCYFISDIRTSTIQANSPRDIDVVWNLSQQYNWVMQIKPKSSMLKFRHPFYFDPMSEFVQLAKTEPYKSDFLLSKKYGIDFVANYKKHTLKYFDGQIRIQAWAGQSSTETRLIVDKLQVIEMDSHEYDDKFYYYNNVERPHGLHLNENADKYIGFDHCGDCALENDIWKKYLKYSNKKIPVISLVKRLSAYLRRPLLKDKHGSLF